MPLIAAVSARVCVLELRTLRMTPAGCRLEEGSEMEVLYEGVAGLDIGKKTLTVCVRSRGRGAGERRRGRSRR